MTEQNPKIIKISVRNLVEFIMRSGDIDNSRGSIMDTEAMQEGSRIHKKIQKSMGSNYSAEVSLSITLPIASEGISFELCIEGRADGIIREEQEPSVIIDEIKGIYAELSRLEEPVPVHRAQVMCYAYIYASRHSLSQIGIRLSYCNIETETMKYFDETLSLIELEGWFKGLTAEYAKWAAWQCQWIEKRNASLQQLVFPFSYRPGQKDLVAGVYRTILRDKKLFIEAPTGVGKTISTLFPTVKAMGEGLVSKIFYLTAKTITRTVAEETLQLLMEQGLLMKAVTITAKDKACILEKSDCNPISCQHAKGHYDRINDAVFDLLLHENQISREAIGQYAEKHRVCPFEMCLDAATWADSIICDYNYAFDPNVFLKRFFMGDKKNDYVFLIDEAHNLVERAREMYSAVVYKESFLKMKSLVKGKSKKLENRLEICNKDLLKLKRECETIEVLEHISDFVLHLLNLMTEYEEFLQEFTSFDDRDMVLEFYLELRHFLNMNDIMDDKYLIYAEQEEDGFKLKLQCMDPSRNLVRCLEKGKSAVFFSATLLPIQYYKEQLGGNEEDYAVYAPSPFQKENRVILIGNDVSTRYTRRNESEYKKIIAYITTFTRARKGNYMVFFPSYQMLNQVWELGEEELSFADIDIQRTNMTEYEKEEFLKAFEEDPARTRIGFCVMGGIFSEGIDLKSTRLIGAVIVGTGLPMVCNERELFRGYYEEAKGAGFDYAYLFGGMNKVLQSAGRVIRTVEDKGAILLLDERFCNRQYQELFPREWYPYITVNQRSMQTAIADFWEITGVV